MMKIETSPEISPDLERLLTGYTEVMNLYLKHIEKQHEIINELLETRSGKTETEEKNFEKGYFREGLEKIFGTNFVDSAYDLREKFSEYMHDLVYEKKEDNVGKIPTFEQRLNGEYNFKKETDLEKLANGISESEGYNFKIDKKTSKLDLYNEINRINKDEKIDKIDKIKYIDSIKKAYSRVKLKGLFGMDAGEVVTYDIEKDKAPITYVFGGIFGDKGEFKKMKQAVYKFKEKDDITRYTRTLLDKKINVNEIIKNIQGEKFIEENLSYHANNAKNSAKEFTKNHVGNAKNKISNAKDVVSNYMGMGIEGFKGLLNSYEQGERKDIKEYLGGFKTKLGDGYKKLTSYLKK